MIIYDEPLIRPPSEADALILQATLGCSHNRCAFCVTYQDKTFRARPEADLFAEIDWAARRVPFVEKAFLADGDAFALSTPRLIRLCDRLRERFPKLRRISAYASPRNFATKSPDELRSLVDAGLTMAYVGLESGDDEVLARIDKGAGHDEMVTLCRKAEDAGLALFVTVILGLGGPRLSARHAAETGRLLSEISPKLAAALSLMLPPRRPSFAEAFGDPEFRELAPDEVLVELRALLEATRPTGQTRFYANHASNYLPLKGTLPRDRDRLLGEIDDALRGHRALRPEWLRGL